MGCIGRVASRVGVGCVLVFGGAAGGFGQIVITELMPNPDAVADGRGEWFELYNAGSTKVNIKEWKIRDVSSMSVHTLPNTDFEIDVNAYVLFAEESTNNGGLPEPDYDYSGIVLGNRGTDGVTILNAMDEVQDTVSYTASWPWGTGRSMSFKDPTVTSPKTANDSAANWCQETETYGDGDFGTPGEASDCGSIPDPITGAIYVIQGSGATSSQARGMATTNNNIVTAVGAGGFFIQTPTADSDNDVDTSDGIFVLYDGSLTINVGDQVDVVGRVEEHFGFTRINATTSVTDAEVTFDNPNQPLPAPVEFNATVPSPNPASPSCAIEFECYEGMRIRIATGTVSSPSQRFGGDPLAEMYITPTSLRAFREKGVKRPGLTSEPAIPVWDGNPERFELDPDRLGLDNVSWVPGTTFSATGVLGYEFSGYEIWPTELSGLNLVPPLPHAVRPRGAGEVTVASVNMLQLNDGSLTYGTKRSKQALYIRNVLRSPDIIGVQEVETLAALRGLADEIRRGDSNASYTPYLEIGNRVPGINVGFLVRSGVTVGSVTQLNKEETYVNPSNSMTVHLNDRPPMRLDAAVQGIEFSVIVVHNRSLIGIDGSDGERVRQKRFEQAQSVARLAQSLKDEKLLIVGDFNAYQFTDGYVDVIGQISGNVTPSENLVSGPDLVDPNLVNLIERLPAEQRYSYYFDNNAQLLDHALVNETMAGSVVDIQYARGNVDARAAHRSDPDTPLGASDHDGFVVYLSAPGRPAPGGGGSPGGGGGGVEAQADLSLDAESRIVSGGVVRFSVSVDNAGPDTARNVVVGSSLRGVASIQASTSGCEEDPDGVSTCTLGDIAAEDSASFRIDVDTGIAGEASVRYTGSAGSDTKDPRPDDDEIGIVQPLGPPNAPSDLVATAISSTEIELQWRDNSNAETAFAVFQQGPGDSRLRVIGTVPANTTSTVVEELVPDTTYRFAVEAYNGPLRSERTPKSTATTWFSDAARCSQDDVLCLGNFEVEVEWNDGKGGLGRGMAEQLTAESGDFWFFHPANIELVVEVLDGCQVNGHYWVFAAGLTDVEVTTTVRDLKSGLEMSWTNPQGTLFEPLGDTWAFATCGEASNASRSLSAVRLSGAPKGRAAELYRASLTQADRVGMASSACTASETALCLQNSRYEVQANWQTGERSGAATVIPRTADTGMFWFFSQGNVELIVKVLDGCALNGHRWVLMGGLTDVGVEIMVTDSESGEAKMYGNPEGSPFATMFDVTAFSCSAGQ